MPAFCHQVHPRWVRVRLGDRSELETLWTLPTLTKAATDYFLTRPPFAQSVTPVAGRAHPADARTTPGSPSQPGHRRRQGCRRRR